MSLSYSIKEGFAGFKRAKLASLTSMFSLFVAVLLLGIITRAAFNIYELTITLKKDIEIEVFLKDVNEMTIKNIGKKIESNPFVSQVDFISKDSAATVFKRDFGTNNNPLADFDFLPASYKVKLKQHATVGGVDDLIVDIEQLNGVDEVEFARDLMLVLENRFQNLIIGGVIISALIIIAAIVLIFNTIRLTIYAKRSLIRAMKLVGATNRFIRRPFLIEGMFQGLISGLFAVGFLFVLFSYVVPVLIPQFQTLIWPYGQWYYLCGAMVVFSILLGLIGSRWASRRFLKEGIDI